MRNESNGHGKTTDRNLAPFLAELAALSIKYRIGIAGDPILFCMEDEDLQIVAGEPRFQYCVDEESHLSY